jgi:hypothetical protein
MLAFYSWSPAPAHIDCLCCDLAYRHTKRQLGRPIATGYKIGTTVESPIAQQRTASAQRSGPRTPLNPMRDLTICNQPASYRSNRSYRLRKAQPSDNPRYVNDSCRLQRFIVQLRAFKRTPVNDWAFTTERALIVSAAASSLVLKSSLSIYSCSCQQRL